MRVAIADIDAAALAGRPSVWGGDGVDGLTVPTDVTRQEAVKEPVERVVDRFD